MKKYVPVPRIPVRNRKWPENSIKTEPIWCSVDLRDGNQALAVPMNIENKLAYFDLLVKTGFKEIEVGFPSSSQTEFDFVRRLVEQKRIPDDVTIQVLCQARDSLIKRTIEAVDGAPSVIFHLYNSTSPSQLKYTYNRTQDETLAMAVQGVRLVKKCIASRGNAVGSVDTQGAAGNAVGSVDTQGATGNAVNATSTKTKYRLEYSPENFNETDCDYAVKICEAVKAEWGATSDNKIILNLPTSMENATPNVFADQVEYFSEHITGRETVVLSVHTHNDRGTGVAAAELALLAGAERVEGTLFGNGERTGNLDLVTLSLNMFAQGIKTSLDFSHVLDTRQKFSSLTGMNVYPRQPYAGDLVFTAFSGSHQDAIRKAIKARSSMEKDARWEVPYLIIDPHDIGREYEELIRINSQSGKGGAAWILETDFGLCLPSAMQPVFGGLVKTEADRLQRELTPSEIYQIFLDTYLEKREPLRLLDLAETHVVGSSSSIQPMQVLCRASVSWKNEVYSIGDKGNGPLDAFVAALRQTPAPRFSVSAFHEHSIGSGSDTDALAYIEITAEDTKHYWGCGRSSNIGRAGIDGVISAINQIRVAD